MAPRFSEDRESAIPLHVIEQPAFDSWMQDQDDRVRDWIAANGFNGAKGQALLIPDEQGRPLMALAGFATPGQRARRRFVLASAVENLPKGVYDIVSGLEGQSLETECFGWLMTHHKFGRYRSQKTGQAALVAPDGIDAGRVETMVAAEVLIRDLIDTPSADMGPAEIEDATAALAGEFGATFDVLRGDDLLAHNFPMIHAVGRASVREPRLLDLRWGDAGPRITLVGKGVCFDTGGLNLKPRSGMALMKKDMGGAATVLGIARMIMARGLPVRLRVLIPAVENSVSGNAFRPGDILTSRKGLTVEINNTDAEGRLVLADALALADEEKPDLIVSMATLTGAARIAVGSDLAPYFTDHDDIADALAASGRKVEDPVWRLPFHDPYELKIEPANADLDNAPSSGFAGAITAALFLRRFVDHSRYVHFDIYAWHSSNLPGRPKGGYGQGARALFDALPQIFDL